MLTHRLVALIRDRLYLYSRSAVAYVARQYLTVTHTKDREQEQGDSLNLLFLKSSPAPVAALSMPCFVAGEWGWGDLGGPLAG